MPSSDVSMVERIARVLGAYQLSRNAEGQEVHADEAVAILRTMREPDSLMAKAGDVAVWSKMIAVTLADAERDDTLQ